VISESSAKPWADSNFSHERTGWRIVQSDASGESGAHARQAILPGNSRLRAHLFAPRAVLLRSDKHHEERWPSPREVHTGNDVHLQIEDAVKWLASHLGIHGWAAYGVRRKP
jgi:hypothetical protein